MCSIAHTNFVDFSSQYGVRGAVRNRAWPCSGQGHQGFCLRFETLTHIQKPCLCLIVFIDFLHSLPIHCSIVHELSFGCTHCVVWGRLWSIFSRFSPNTVYSLLLLYPFKPFLNRFWNTLRAGNILRSANGWNCLHDKFFPVQTGTAANVSKRMVVK